MTIQSAYTTLAKFVSDDISQITRWTKDQASQRYKAMVKKYKETKMALDEKNGKKFGLSPEEFQDKMTIERKLEKECYRFRDLDALYGDRQNVKPSFVADSSDPVFQFDVDDEEVCTLSRIVINRS